MRRKKWSQNECKELFGSLPENSRAAEGGVMTQGKGTVTVAGTVSLVSLSSYV